jgi:hypothetical protein
MAIVMLLEPALHASALFIIMVGTGGWHWPVRRSEVEHILGAAADWDAGNGTPYIIAQLA